MLDASRRVRRVRRIPSASSGAAAASSPTAAARADEILGRRFDHGLARDVAGAALAPELLAMIDVVANGAKEHRVCAGPDAMFVVAPLVHSDRTMCVARIDVSAVKDGDVQLVHDVVGVLLPSLIEQWMSRMADVEVLDLLERGLKSTSAKLGATRALIGFFSDTEEAGWQAIVDQLGPHHTPPREALAALRSGLPHIGPDDAWVPIYAPIGINGFFGFSGFVRAPSHAMIGVLSLLAFLSENAFPIAQGSRNLRSQLSFEAVIIEALSSFVAAEPNEVDNAIMRSLGNVCEVLGFGRALMFAAGEGRPECKFEWCAPGVPSFVELFQPLTDDERPIEFWQQLVRGENIRTFTRDFPPDFYPKFVDILKSSGVTATVGVPLFAGDKHCGGLVLEIFDEQPEIPDSIFSHLRVLGGGIVAAVAHQRARRSLETANEQIRALQAHAERERDYLREQSRLGGIIGDSPAMRRVLETVDAAAPTPSSILIRGESGVGKELIANAIHERSQRRDGPLIKVNCAALSPTLFESEFFGHVRGAFTGADRDRAGRFELADGGTLLLDEVGELPPQMQVKLLRVLQDGELERVGDTKTRRVDVRIIAATNRDLERAVATGEFRADLFYRLSVVPIRVPPLRERRGDVPALATHFLRDASDRIGRHGFVFDDAQLAALIAYEWPGNVRELRNVIERAVVLSKEPPLQLDVALAAGVGANARADASADVRAQRVSGERLPSHEKQPWSGRGTGIVANESATEIVKAIVKEDERIENERDNIIAALERCHWRVAGEHGAADLLGLRPSTLRDRMRALKIVRPDKTAAGL